MSKVAGITAFILLFMLIRCTLVKGSRGASDPNDLAIKIARQRSLCNTFGGCGARHMSSGPSGAGSLRMAAPYMRQQAPSAAMNSLQARRPSNSAEPKQQAAGEQPVALVLGSPRMGRFVEEQPKLETIGRGMRMRRNQ